MVCKTGNTGTIKKIRLVRNTKKTSLIYVLQIRKEIQNLIADLKSL